MVKNGFEDGIFGRECVREEFVSPWRSLMQRARYYLDPWCFDHEEDLKPAQRKYLRGLSLLTQVLPWGSFAKAMFARMLDGFVLTDGQLEAVEKMIAEQGGVDVLLDRRDDIRRLSMLAKLPVCDREDAEDRKKVESLLQQAWRKPLSEAQRRLIKAIEEHHYRARMLLTNKVIEQNRSKATINGYASDMRAFIVWLELERNKVRWEDLETDDLHAFIKAMQAEGDRKTNTVNRRVAALSSFFRWALSSGQLITNLAEDIHALPAEKVGVRFLTKDQQETLIREIEKSVRLARLRFPKRWLARQRDASMVKLLLHTGLRLAEELNLLMSDFQMFDRKGAVIVRSANPSRERVVPLNAEARKAVLEWLAVRPEADTDYAWIAVENENPATALSGRSVQRVVRRFGQEAGIENLTTQILRHTFAKNLADSGISLEKIAALLGYVGLNAPRIYTEPSLQDLQKAVEKLEPGRK